MSGTISQNDAYAWKAKAISRGKLLERFRDLTLNMADNVTNEGDRVYFGSTNDYDELREIGQEMDMWKWDAIMRERPEPDPYADCRQLRAALAAKDAEIAKLREALQAIADDASVPQQMYDRNGPQWTSPQGNEYEDTSAYLAKCNEIAEQARAALAGGSDA